MTNEVKVYYKEFDFVYIKSENEILDELIEYLNSIYKNFEYCYSKKSSYIKVWDLRKYIPKILEFCMKKGFVFECSVKEEEVGE